jgi:uncharacterized repeat protein (TIGR03803 family)
MLLTLIAGSSASAAPALTQLAVFTPGNGNPLSPYQGLAIDSSGNLYGTTLRGGQYGVGAVFRIDAATRALTTLVSFNGTNGRDAASSLLVSAAGDLYGTTYLGGATNNGTLFQIDANTHALTTLVSFNGANGSGPYNARLISDTDGNLYGTTEGGGAAGYGTVFKFNPLTRTLTTLATFDNTNGAYPAAGLIFDKAGNLIGTTNRSGTLGLCTVFKIFPNGTLTTLASLNPYSIGIETHGNLVSDALGNLFGITGYKGSLGYGEVFKVDARTNAVSTVASFNQVNGANPEAGLLIDAAGNLFGVTPNGGAKGGGTLFEVAAGTHSITALISFDYLSGYSPFGALVADSYGNLYGTTPDGGGGMGMAQGIAFEVTGSGFVVAPEPAAFSLIAFAAIPLLRRRNKA